MPYINNKGGRRIDLVSGTCVPNDAGELNFVFTVLCNTYLDEHKLSYQTLNDISGAMTEALAEFRRRVIVPYEKTKIRKNGDVY